MRLHVGVFILCALYGSIFSIGKIALEYAPPAFLTGSRMLVAGLLLLLYQYIFNKKEYYFKKELLLPISLVAILGVYATNVLEFWGLQYMASSKACFIYSFSPIATALMSYFCFQEKITLQKWLGLLLGILGFIPVLLMPAPSETNIGTFCHLTYAELALLGAALATSIGWINMRAAVKKYNYSPVMVNALSMFLGGGISLVHSLCTENWSPSPILKVLPFSVVFIVLTLISNIICYNLHGFLLRFYTATYISFAGLSTPFFAALFGWMFLDEIMPLSFWVSVIFVSLGLYIYYKEELKQGHAPKKLIN